MSGSSPSNTGSGLQTRMSVELHGTAMQGLIGSVRCVLHKNSTLVSP